MIKQEKCTVTDVKFKSNKFHPIIVSFQNGLLQSEDAQRFECQVYNIEQTRGKRMVEMSSTDSIIYRGSEPLHDDKICRTLLAVRNKKTNDIRLIEADSIQLAPVLPDDPLEVNASTTQDNSGWSTLNKTFGSKRIKRRTELKERMVFEVQTMANQLNQAASGVEIDEQNLAQPTVDSLDTLIPCNKLASSVDQVYKLEDIISQYELDSLQEEATNILDNIESCTEDMFSKYFCHYIRHLPLDNQLQHIKMLLYSECLLKLYCIHSSEIRKKNFCICPFSEIINSKILDCFTITKNYRCRPLSMQDKILCHVIVLGILGNKFVLNLEPLIKTPKIKGVRVLELCKALGLVPASKANKSVVTLKLPLPTVSPVLKKRKRK